jgi:hypothetical protein
VQLYPDEFVSLLAIEMIGQTGLPVMPSGLFYEHGLLFSYLASLLSGLGPLQLMARYLSMGTGLLSVLLVYWVGQRWFSPVVGLFAATGLTVAPAAIHWSSRARMYSLLQLFILLTLYLFFTGIIQKKAFWRWLGLAIYLGAALTHFGAVALAPPLIISVLVLNIGPVKPAGWRHYVARLRPYWIDAVLLVLILAVAFLVKRAGQPRGIDPLESSATAAVTGIAQVFSIYSDFSFNLVGGWWAIAPFFVSLPALFFSVFALVAMGITLWQLGRWWRRPAAIDTMPWMPHLFLSLILLVTTLEMIFLVSPHRRDDKYLFMLLPVLFLLGATGLVFVGRALFLRLFQHKPNSQLALYTSLLAPIVAVLLILVISWPAVQSLLTNTGDDYDAAFTYVKEHWQPGDTILTGTPAAAMFYLGRSDFYSVQRRGGYDYRILKVGGKPVDRWLASPAIRTEAELVDVLKNNNVWLVLERWGLQREYYDLPFQQQLLAQTDYVSETQGIFILHSKPDPQPILPEPVKRVTANFANQVQILGYTLEPPEVTAGQSLRLTLYWQATAPIPDDYTVFVHLRFPEGGNATQADHQPLGNIFPTSVWPVGEIIRETSELALPADIPPGQYQLWTGLYNLETGERLPVEDDRSGENAVRLGTVEVSD